MHAFVPAILLRMAGLDALDLDAEPQPPDGEFGQVEERIGAGEGDAVVRPDRGREAALAKELLKGGDCGLFLGSLHGLAHEQEARGMIGDGQGITVPATAELELALEIGTPELIGSGALRERRSLRPAPPSTQALDQVMAVENRMDRAFGGNAEIAVEPPNPGVRGSCGHPSAASPAYSGQLTSRSAPATGWHSGLAVGCDRSRPPARSPCIG